MYNTSDKKIIEVFARNLVSELNSDYGWLYKFESELELLEEEITDQGRYIYKDLLVIINGEQEHDKKLNVKVIFKARLEDSRSDGYSSLTEGLLLTDLQVREPFSGEYYEVTDIKGDFWFHAMNYIACLN